MTGAIIQARTGSSRLASKVMLDLPYGSGETLLGQIIRRVRCAERIDVTVCATTESPADDCIEHLAKNAGIDCFRGSENDVLDRFYRCAKLNGITTIVRFCADSPFIDPSLIDKYIQVHFSNNNDYTGTEGYPLGTNTEIVSFNALESAHAHAFEPTDKEHVTPYIRRHSGTFKVGFYPAAIECQHPDLRLTVDVVEDYVLACALYDYLYRIERPFTLFDVISLVDEKPWLKLINNRIIQKKIFDSLPDEMEELKRLATIYDLHRALRHLGG